MRKKLFALLLACCAASGYAASDYLEEIARQEPFYGPYNLGVLAHLDGRLDDACVQFARAAEGARKLQRGWWQESQAALALGGAYHARRDFKLAEKYYLEGLADYKTMGRYLRASAGLSGLGRIYLESGQLQKAEPLLKEAKDLEYKDSAGKGDLGALAAAVSDLARLRELQGDAHKAELLYQTALKLLSGPSGGVFHAGIGAEQMDSYPIILYRLGELYRRRGDGTAAAASYEKALEAFLLWGGVEARPALKARKLEYRGLTLRALGRKAEAAAEFKEAARLYRQVARPRADGAGI